MCSWVFFVGGEGSFVLFCFALNTVCLVTFPFTDPLAAIKTLTKVMQFFCIVCDKPKLYKHLLSLNKYAGDTRWLPKLFIMKLI